MQKIEKRIFCNNCGKAGHTFNKCSDPITSLGIIACRYNPRKKHYEYIMIKRKDSLGFVDLVRGKYNIRNYMYLRNIFNEMTNDEKDMILTSSFDDLWNHMWNFRTISSRYKNEYEHAKKKYNMIKDGIFINKEFVSIETLIKKSDTSWKETEWGFPKGRRNYRESDIDTAFREFQEETGVSSRLLHLISNLLPMDEIFTGSNYKSYKSRYFICMLPYTNSLILCKQDCEVSDIGWFSHQEAIHNIRNTHKIKKKIISRIENMLNEYMVY